MGRSARLTPLIRGNEKTGKGNLEMLMGLTRRQCVVKPMSAIRTSDLEAVLMTLPSPTHDHSLLDPRLAQ
jgi:hypothetical protein